MIELSVNIVDKVKGLMGWSPNAAMLNKKVEEYIQNKQQLTGLLIGTGLAASIQLALFPPLISFYP